MSSMRSTTLGFTGLALLIVAAQACTYVTEGDVHNHYNLGGQGGESSMGGAASGGAATGGTPNEGYQSFLPECSRKVPLADLDIDLFGEDGHLFYFEVTPEQRVLGDEQSCDLGGGGPIFPVDVVPGFGRGVYDLGGDPECPPHAFNVRIVPAGSDECTDTGKVELDLPGQSSFRPWAEIPNFKLKVDEFQDLEFPSGDKNIRMNNGQADSTIVREAVALRIWRAMGYPAPPTRFVKTQSNVWDTEFERGVFAAHVLVQPYKKAFFKANLPDVTDAWEGEGDPFGEWEGNLECEWSKEDDCDRSLLDDAKAVVQSAPEGSGFMAATASVIDWPLLFENQCLSALTGTGDDWIHNSNNTVLVHTSEGKFFFLPYSTDISGGHPWYPSTPYDGSAVLTTRCAADPECREAALDRCEALITEFEQLDVVTSIVRERCTALEEAGLARGPDARVCEALEEFYAARPAELRSELQHLREVDGGGGAGGMSPL